MVDVDCTVDNVDIFGCLVKKILIINPEITYMDLMKRLRSVAKHILPTSYFYKIPHKTNIKKQGWIIFGQPKKWKGVLKCVKVEDYVEIRCMCSRVNKLGIEENDIAETILRILEEAENLNEILILD